MNTSMEGGKHTRIYGDNQLPTYPTESKVFYERVNTKEDNIEGAIKVLHSSKSTASTKALARVYLDSSYNPRHLPVPVKYYELSMALFDPWKWFKRKMEEYGVEHGLTYRFNHGVIDILGIGEVQKRGDGNEDTRKDRMDVQEALQKRAEQGENTQQIQK